MQSRPPDLGKTGARRYRKAVRAAMSVTVIAVAARKGHGVGKTSRDIITLIAGLGVEGDAHCGERVKHRSRARFNPSLPNLRQVHLIQAELFDELATKGFAIAPGQMGENITTCGVDLLGLPKGTRLQISEAVIEITGLRNPCIQLERMMPGLMAACLDRDADDNLIRKAGVMGIVVAGGAVIPGDEVFVELPDAPQIPLKPV
jgi:MOSC domain-containing protein YiiM